MIKIIFFTKYSSLGASSRLRTFQYIPFYESSGIKCKINCLFNDQYLQELYSKKKINRLNVVKGYLKRLIQLFTVVKYDLVVIEKELFPYLPAFIEQLLKFFKIKYIVDYDDAIFHNYDMHPNPIIKKLLGNKIYSVMKNAETVIAGNTYIAEKANAVGANKIVIIPTVVDIIKYQVKEEQQLGKSKRIIIGWIGSPTTIKYVKEIFCVLQEISSKYPVTIQLVGGKEGIDLHNEDVIEWSEEMEVSFLQNFDIGIMPLCDSPWGKGKCGYKLIQYMSCGVPVVGSPVGVNNEIIKDGVNGFKASSNQDWKSALEQLIENAKLRAQMGIAGRLLVEKKYSLQKSHLMWLKELNNTCFKT